MHSGGCPPVVCYWPFEGGDFCVIVILCYSVQVFHVVVCILLLVI